MCDLCDVVEDPEEQRQGLTLVHFSAQPKPFWSHLPVSPCLIEWGKIMHPTYPPQKMLTSSRKVDECKHLSSGCPGGGGAGGVREEGRGQGLTLVPISAQV